MEIFRIWWGKFWTGLCVCVWTWSLDVNLHSLSTSWLSWWCCSCIISVTWGVWDRSLVEFVSELNQEQTGEWVCDVGAFTVGSDLWSESAAPLSLNYLNPKTECGTFTMITRCKTCRDISCYLRPAGCETGMKITRHQTFIGLSVWLSAVCWSTLSQEEHCYTCRIHGDVWVKLLRNMSDKDIMKRHAQQQYDCVNLSLSTVSGLR